MSAWRRNEALALDGAMKLECTTAQLKWSLSASMAHEAERTTVRCEDGRAGGGAMEFAASTAALQLMECAPSTVRLETDLATSMARLETDLATSWRDLKRSACPRRRDNRVGLNIPQIELLAIWVGGEALCHCDKIMRRPDFCGDHNRTIAWQQGQGERIFGGHGLC